MNNIPRFFLSILIILIVALGISLYVFSQKGKISFYPEFPWIEWHPKTIVKVDNILGKSLEEIRMTLGEEKGRVKSTYTWYKEGVSISVDMGEAGEEAGKVTFGFEKLDLVLEEERDKYYLVGLKPPEVPPTREEGWRKIWKSYRNYGLLYVHSPYGKIEEIQVSTQEYEDDLREKAQKKENNLSKC